MFFFYPTVNRVKMLRARKTAAKSQHQMEFESSYARREHVLLLIASRFLNYIYITRKSALALAQEVVGRTVDMSSDDIDGEDMLLDSRHHVLSVPHAGRSG